MISEQEKQQMELDLQTTGIFTALVLAAISEPNFDKASYLAKVEGTFAKMAPKYNKHLLDLARTVVGSIKDR